MDDKKRSSSANISDKLFDQKYLVHQGLQERTNKQTDIAT